MQEGAHQKSFSFASSFSYSVATHIGQRREENQDSFGVSIANDCALFAIADGMGGASGGARASSMTMKIIEDGFIASLADGTAHKKAVEKSIADANSQIFSLGKSNIGLEGMGTTISGILLSSSKILLFNVGDSRVYRIRNNSITQLTIDHTLVGELVDSGALTEEQAGQSPVSHMLTRSVGPAPEVEIDCSYLEDGPAREDIYLICSDGLYNTISSAEIGYVIGEYRLEEALEHLVGLANMRGGADNITGVLIECGASFPEATSGSSSDKYSQDANKFVHIDIAETEAAGAFSKVKKEVDISAEILWGAQKRRTVANKAGDNTKKAAAIATQNKSRFEQILLISGVVFFVTLLSAIWIGTNRQTKTENNATLPALKVKGRILDLSEQEKEKSEKSRKSGDIATTLSVREEIISRLRPGIKTGTEAERLSLRKSRIEKARRDIELQLNNVYKLVDPEFVEYQKQIQLRRGEVKQRIFKTKNEIDSIDVSLKRWQKKLLNLDEAGTVNLASELVNHSKEVQEAKKEFESATWEYLKALEMQKADPQDTSSQDKINQLIQLRNTKLENLSSRSRLAVESIIAKDSADRGLLLIELEELELDEKSLMSDLEYINVRLTEDAEKRRAFEEDLKKRSESLKQELQGLREVNTN